MSAGSKIGLKQEPIELLNSNTKYPAFFKQFSDLLETLVDPVFMVFLMLEEESSEPFAIAWVVTRPEHHNI